MGGGGDDSGRTLALLDIGWIGKECVEDLEHCLSVSLAGVSSRVFPRALESLHSITSRRTENGSLSLAGLAGG